MDAGRRAVLKGIPAALVGASGCLSTQQPVTFALGNETDRPTHVSAQITVPVGGERVLEETVQLEPGGGRIYEDAISGNSARISVTVDDGPENTRTLDPIPPDLHVMNAMVHESSVAFVDGQQ